MGPHCHPLVFVYSEEYTIELLEHCWTSILSTFIYGKGRGEGRPVPGVIVTQSQLVITNCIGLHF